MGERGDPKSAILNPRPPKVGYILNDFGFRNEVKSEIPNPIFWWMSRMRGIEEGKPFRFATPQEKRVEVYYAPAAGASIRRCPHI